MGISGSLHNLAFFWRFPVTLSLVVIFAVLTRFVPRVLLDSGTRSSYPSLLSSGRESCSVCCRDLLRVEAMTGGSSGCETLRDVHEWRSRSTLATNYHHAPSQPVTCSVSRLSYKKSNAR